MPICMYIYALSHSLFLSLALFEHESCLNMIHFLHLFLHFFTSFAFSLCLLFNTHQTRARSTPPLSLSLSLSLAPEHYPLLLATSATHCNTLQHTANTLQHTTTEHDLLCCILTTTATHCNTLQHTASHCNTRHLYTIHFLHFDDQCILRGIDGE